MSPTEAAPPHASSPIKRHKPDYICLISADGEKISIETDVACQSPTLKMMISSQLGFKEASTCQIELNDISGPLLNKAVQYLHYKKKYNGSENAPSFDLDPSEVLDVMLVADYLDI